ncbi:MAG: Re/Si-specific NAD(P)(+) transhydrogenase subunit alpha [Alphaproteobacteria bacterium]|nr:Re/Si-specific NAD(P)(+) transhydrogenase subunit alpha [Alphaproteobacteria bacterium]
MIIAILKETTPSETRVAATPDVVKKYVDLGFKIQVESSAGVAAGFSDAQYSLAGAKICKTPADTLKKANIIIKVNAPLLSEDHLFSPKQIVIADFKALSSPQRIEHFCKLGLTCFALDLMPRISRAQSMDILSSQSNLAGYKAVIEAFNLLPQAAPMMMTAAGTIPPAKVLVLGAGVAGLQAIATAKRLGAIVYASDVRPATKEQVESLGGKFLNIEPESNAETSGGYAQATSKQFQKMQQKAIGEILPQINIVITTALLQGKPAPRLISATMLKKMTKGSVIIDMASSTGGNVEGSQNNKTVDINGIKIVGNSNLAASIPLSASKLFAQNIFNFIKSQFNNEQKELKFDFSDELISATCICQNGKVYQEKK